MYAMQPPRRKPKRNNHAKQKRYAEMLMERNAKNPNISPEQALFLQKLSEYRHLIHSNPHQYFFNTKKSVEIDAFFALAHSQAYFEKLDLPYPKDMFNLLLQMKSNRDMQFTDYEKAVEQFAYNSEAANTLIERYLQRIDDEKETLYCPSGDLRNTATDPIRRTIDKLNTAQERISPYQKKIQQELDKLNKAEENPRECPVAGDMDL